MSEFGVIEADKDLVPLLRQCDSDDLVPLVSHLKKCGRVSRRHKKSDNSQETAQTHKMNADEIAGEVQKCGGNKIGNLGRRGKGVPYREIVYDVAKKLKVEFDRKREVEFIEQQILLKVIETAWGKMSDAEKRELRDRIGDNFKSLPITINANEFGLIGIQELEPGVMKKAIWALFDIASPAYRVTIPCVIHIAMLRQKYMLEEQEVKLSGGMPGGMANKMPESGISA